MSPKVCRTTASVATRDFGLLLYLLLVSGLSLRFVGFGLWVSRLLGSVFRIRVKVLLAV